MTTPKPLLSKTRIQNGRQCHKRLWLEMHQPDLVVWTDEAQARLDEGTRFGELARQLLGGGVLVEAGHREVEQALADTAALLVQPWQTTPMLFEPAFSHRDVRVRVDAYLRGSDGDTLIEVKSTTGVKSEHIWDCAIQTWVARGSGRNVSKVELAHLDRDFVYELEGDYTGLLVREDITANVEALQPKIPAIVERLESVARGEMPAITTGPQCDDPYPCPFFEHCRAAEPPGPEFPVTLLPHAKVLIERLVAEGHVDLCKVPLDVLEKPGHRRIARATRSNRPFISSKLERVLGEIGYPRHFLDFETIMYAVPRWIGTRPFQQLPFQFSCHTQQNDGRFTHAAFLDVSGQSPLRDFVEALLDAVGTEGPVLVWNQSFEATRLRELADRFPRKAEALQAVIARMVDLLPIYRNHYYHRDMRGSWSIKAVLPTVAPELDYGDLAIGDGGAAQAAYKEAIHPDTSEVRREELKTQLLAYCERDTLAMVRLARRP
ncbi:MAG: DUF2779 domain-containing protein [Lysobacterales bacterium]